MKISTQGRYGVRAMFELAKHYGEGPVALKAVAEQQAISEKYLDQIMAPVRKAGLVGATRGAQGGYFLTQDPAAITVKDIIEVLEGPIAPVECVARNLSPGQYCGRASQCVTRNVWQKLQDKIETFLASVSLADLVNDDMNKANKTGEAF